MKLLNYGILNYEINLLNYTIMQLVELCNHTINYFNYAIMLTMSTSFNLIFQLVQAQNGSTSKDHNIV